MAKIDLCKLFEVEPNEEFKLSGISGTLMVNSDNELMFKQLYHTNIWTPFVEQINLTAQREVEKFPFVPKVGEVYWTVDEGIAYKSSFNWTLHQVSKLELGLCYRTKAQAEQEGIPKIKALMEKWGCKN